MNRETDKEAKDPRPDDALEVLLRRHADCVLVFGGVERLELLDRIRPIFGILEAIERIEEYDEVTKFATKHSSAELPKRITMTKDRFKGFEDNDGAWEGLVDRFLAWALRNDRDGFKDVRKEDVLYIYVLAHVLQMNDIELVHLTDPDNKERLLGVQYFVARFEYETVIDDERQSPLIEAKPGDVHWFFGRKFNNMMRTRGADWTCIPHTLPHVQPGDLFDLATPLGNPEADPRASRLTLDRASFNPETGIVRLGFLAGGEERVRLTPWSGGSFNLHLLLFRRCLRFEFGVYLDDTKEFVDEKMLDATPNNHSQCTTDPKGRIELLKSFRRGDFSDAKVVICGVEVPVHLAWMRHVSALFAEADSDARRFEVDMGAWEVESWLKDHIVSFFDWIYGIVELEDVGAGERYAYCIFGVHLRLFSSYLSRLSNARINASVSCGIQQAVIKMTTKFTSPQFAYNNYMQDLTCIISRRVSYLRRRVVYISYPAQTSLGDFLLKHNDSDTWLWEEFRQRDGLKWSYEELRRRVPSKLRNNAKDPTGVILEYDTGESERYVFSPGLTWYVDLEWVAIHRALREHGIDIAH